MLIDLIFDPQTSGGLVISLGSDVADACLKELKEEGIQAASIIGDVLYPHPKGRLKIAYSNS
jgi:selenide,water dikinase